MAQKPGVRETPSGSGGRFAEFPCGARNMNHLRQTDNKRSGPSEPHSSSGDGGRRSAGARPALFGFLFSSICDPVVFPSVLLWELQRRTIKWNDHRQDTPHLLLILSFPPPRVALLFSGTATSAQLHYDHSHQCGRLGWDNHWLFLVSRLKELMESATSPHIPHIYTHTHTPRSYLRRTSSTFQESFDGFSG